MELQLFLTQVHHLMYEDHGKKVPQMEEQFDQDRLMGQNLLNLPESKCNVKYFLNYF